METEPVLFRVSRSDNKDEPIVLELWNRPRFYPAVYKRISITQEKLDMLQLILSALVEL